jgi:hypothetical protein
MRHKSLIGLAVFAAAALATSSAFAWDQDFFGMYFHRSDTITMSAGNAQDTNAATHVIDPWPRYVGNRNIPANGERMARAIERYRCIDRSPLGVPPIIPAYGTTIGIAGLAVAAQAQAGAGGCAGGSPSANR